MKDISTGDFRDVLLSIEQADLSDAFWSAALVQALDTSSLSNPLLGAFWAAQIRAGDKGFLSSDITVASLIENKGDVHHVFPRDYLKSGGRGRAEYNQVANFVHMQSEPNVRIGNKAPMQYMGEVVARCASGETSYGTIKNLGMLKENLRQNCIPAGIECMTLRDYPSFLEERRGLMAAKMRDYYYSL